MEQKVTGKGTRMSKYRYFFKTAPINELINCACAKLFPVKYKLVIHVTFVLIKSLLINIIFMDISS